VREKLLSALATVAVCVAAMLVFDRFLPFTYPAAVTTPVLLLHGVTRTLFAIFMMYCIQQKYTTGKLVLWILVGTFLIALTEMLIGFPATKDMPKWFTLHEVVLSVLSMIVFALFWRPAPPAVQSP
jgi:Na+/glutamate symporter